MDDERRNAFLDTIHQKIAEFGCTVIAVGACEEDNTPQFAYTIGLTTKHGYELAMSGAEFEDMHRALNQIATRIEKGLLDPRDGLLVEGVLEGGYLLRLKLADPSWGDTFPWVDTALELEGPPPFWQVQFPAYDGKWPDEEGYNPDPYVQLDYTVQVP